MRIERATPTSFSATIPVRMTMLWLLWPRTRSYLRSAIVPATGRPASTPSRLRRSLREG